MTRSRNATAGFTLVELLVVIGSGPARWLSPNFPPPTYTFRVPKSESRSSRPALFRTVGLLVELGDAIAGNLATTSHPTG
jgi:hypothetical protein